MYTKIATTCLLICAIVSAYIYGLTTEYARLYVEEIRKKFVLNRFETTWEVAAMVTIIILGLISIAGLLTYIWLN